jgi:predicted dienelactone hydrolase
MRRKSTFLALCVGLGISLCGLQPTLAAERLVVSYGALQRSVPITAVRTFIQEGEVTPETRAYATLLNSQELANLRTALQGGVKLGVVPVDNFLNSTSGNALLQKVGEIIRIGPNLTGEKAVSAALILSAGKEDGINLVNFLENFPNSEVFVDGLKLQDTVAKLQNLVNEARKVGLADTQQGPASFTAPSGLKDPTERGPYSFQQIRLEQNQRPQITDLYLSSAKGARPVIIISHGLGEDRETYRYLAEHWASYGFQVLVPEHPGSDQKRMLDLLAGRFKEVVEPQEFINRPRDITNLLNNVTQLNRTDARFKNRLNLRDVGVYGHSFGGYTALALAGAPLDPPYLRKVCASSSSQESLPNLSFLFQCRAQDNGPLVTLRDTRVKAIIAASPMSSVVFGEKGLARVAVPSLMVAASDDTVAPALLEQSKTAALLPAPAYLMTLVGATHFSLQGDRKSPVPENLPQFGDSSPQARQSFKAISTAFWKTYLKTDTRYHAFLAPGYSPPGGLETRILANHLKQALAPSP